MYYQHPMYIRQHGHYNPGHYPHHHHGHHHGHHGHTGGGLAPVLPFLAGMAISPFLLGAFGGSQSVPGAPGTGYGPPPPGYGPGAGYGPGPGYGPYPGYYGPGYGQQSGSGGFLSNLFGN